MQTKQMYSDLKQHAAITWVSTGQMWPSPQKNYASHVPTGYGQPIDSAKIGALFERQPRLVYSYPWQPESSLDVFVDADFAGCLATRRSTSGGVALRGAHLIKHWSSTQRAVTLSSAEAELYDLFKGTTEALGIQSWGRDLGLEMAVRMHAADSAAAIGICGRSSIISQLLVLAI